MKNPINKRIGRQIVKNPGKFLPIILAMVFVVVFASSFFTYKIQRKHFTMSKLTKEKWKMDNLQQFIQYPRN